MAVRGLERLGLDDCLTLGCNNHHEGDTFFHEALGLLRPRWRLECAAEDAEDEEYAAGQKRPVFVLDPQAARESVLLTDQICPRFA